MRIVLAYDSEGLKPDHFELLEDFTLTADDGTAFEVREGLITDGASVPGWAQSIVHPIGRDFAADAFHDAYYMQNRSHSFSRRQIDGYWLEFMRRFNPDKKGRTVLKYGLVRALGWWNWYGYKLGLFD